MSRTGQGNSLNALLNSFNELICGPCVAKTCCQVKIFENVFFIFVLNWIWGMRNCSIAGLQVIIVCQKLHSAKVTQEKYATRKLQGFMYCIVQQRPSIHYTA